MYVNTKKINRYFLNWLIISLILVFFIIIIGGLTRLTNSGLSITEWELFKGILPPLNSIVWNEYFNEYKKIPQYKILNYNMSLIEFKIDLWSLDSGVNRLNFVLTAIKGFQTLNLFK